MRVRPGAQPKLIAAAAQLLGLPVDGVHDVRREPLEYDVFLAGRRLTRVHGRASVGTERHDFSLIEKLTDAPATVSDYLYDNATREFAAYRSGLLHDLAPGLAAPALLGSEQGPDGELALWLEDVGPRGPISHDDLLATARHLGRLAGRWLGRVPDDEWLFSDWIERHQQTPAMAAGLEVVEAAAADRRVELRIGRSLHEACDLIRRQAAYRAALERLPLTLCHHDAVVANVVPRRDGQQLETVLIDWESVGPGPAGADLASLLFSSARRGDISARSLPALIPDAMTAYGDGVRDVEADVGGEELRLAFLAAISLRWSLVRDVVRALTGGGEVRRGSAHDEPSETALDELVFLTGVLLDAATEARTRFRVPRSRRRP